MVFRYHVVLVTDANLSVESAAQGPLRPYIEEDAYLKVCWHCCSLTLLLPGLNVRRCSHCQ